MQPCLLRRRLSEHLVLRLSDCEGDLECYDRDEGEDGPQGCLGTPFKNYDYCHDPNWSEASLDDVAVDPEVSLSRCQGDCDRDE